MSYKKLVRRILVFLIILLIGIVSFLLYMTKDDINADLSNIEQKLNRFYDSEKMGGFAVSVFNGDSVVYANGFGYSDVEERKPYTTQTVQYVASISKTAIGIALVKAQELELLNIEDKINDYLPFAVSNPYFPDDEITIRQLATHTSSLDYNEKVVESLYLGAAPKDMSLEAFMFNYFKNETYGEIAFSSNRPGTDWNYSNLGSGLVAYIIELVSGMSFAEFTKVHVFDPLELSNTHWDESESDSLLHTSYYSVSDSSIGKTHTSGIVLYPCRDMITNIDDLTKYCQAIMSRDSAFLGPGSFDKLLLPKLSNRITSMEDDNSGLFFMIDRNNYGINYQLTGMSGGDNCIQTMMYFDSHTQLGYIFMGNTGSSELNRSNHIWIYNALVSLGCNNSLANSQLIDRVKYRWHNVYNRVRSLF